MQRHLVTFVNYNSDYSTDTDKEKYFLFKQFNSERNVKYCQKHNINYIEADESVYRIPQMFTIPDNSEFTVKNNNHFARWQFFRDNIDNGAFKEGDVIHHHDADLFVVQTDKLMPADKSFTYAIDTGNTHCFGAFTLKVNEFGNKLINLMLDKVRFNKLSKIKFFKEDSNADVLFYWGDQQAYYIAAGIKCHSWEPFYKLSNYGFYTYPTEHTIFTLEELNNNVDILPTNWNVTHVPEEQGYSIYYINPCNRADIVFRHFAGGQRWNFEEYERMYPL